MSSGSAGAGRSCGGVQGGSDADREAAERAQELGKAADQAYLGAGGVLVMWTAGLRCWHCMWKYSTKERYSSSSSSSRVTPAECFHTAVELSSCLVACKARLAVGHTTAHPLQLQRCTSAVATWQGA